MHRAKLVFFGLIGLATAELAVAQSQNATVPSATPAPSPAATQSPAQPATNTDKSADAMEGLAAVYSDKLNGHKTASGETFHQTALTAAHPSLPFGTKVKVTNTQNNKSVEVRINDRGTETGRSRDGPVERCRLEDRDQQDRNRARQARSRQ